jgi:hypothetical protein
MVAGAGAKAPRYLVGSKLQEDWAEAVKLAKAAAKRIDFFMQGFI